MMKPIGLFNAYTAAMLLAFAIPQAKAQSLALVPGQVQYQFRPGQPFQFDLAVSNGGAAPVVVQTSVTDLWYNEKNEKVFDPPGTSPHSAANWIEVVPPQITLPAGGTGKVNVVVTPPHASLGRILRRHIRGVQARARAGGHGGQKSGLYQHPSGIPHPSERGQHGRLQD